MNIGEKNIVIMNFSGIYEHEKFYKNILCENDSYFWIELRDLSGCNCYCDDEAKKVIREKISDFSGEEIHFIDSGNYHYMSRIWLEKIGQPFRLLVFDNHTDMQPPAFGGILSCGGWIVAALEELENMKEIILVGPDEEDYEEVEDFIKEKTIFLSRAGLGEKVFLNDIPTDLPLYISIDKDVLSKMDASTTWSQGDMRFSEMYKYLEIVLKKFEEAGQKIIGIDICGECDLNQMSDNDKNDSANEKLLELLLQRL